METYQVAVESSHYSGSSDSENISMSDDRSNVQSGSSTTGESTTRSPDELVIAKAENRAVFQIRLAVMAFLLSCTVGVAVVVYLNTANGEKAEFESDFLDFSDKVLDSFGSSLEQSLSAADAFVVSAVSYANATNMSWPFVTLPDFGTRASKVRVESKAVRIVEIPIVPDSDRQRWDDYSLRNGNAWVEENLRVQKNDPTFLGNVIEDYVLLPIHNFSLQQPIARLEYFPLWQEYPTASSFSPFNFDFSIYEPLYSVLDVLRSRKAIIGPVSNYPEESFAKFINSLLAEYVGNEGFDTTEPSSELFYPMYDNAAEEVSFNDENGNVDKVGGKMVAVLFMAFYWRDLMTDILPSGIEGIELVVENACGQNFTYRVNGQQAEFLGYGDKHDHKFDRYEQRSDLVFLKRDSPSGKYYTGVTLSNDKCPYMVRVYPSQVFEDAYRSSNPWVYTSLAVSIFIFTSLVFWCYDYLVEQRQQKVMSTAIKSSAIVSSLFPSNVRARLYDDATNLTSQKSRLKTFMNNTPLHEKTTDPKSSLEATMGRPIADLFPDATVLFADVAGFTAWSSTREPNQVFVLLETLYGIFDRLATRRNVFKVETIGDSYMAVAGLPDPRVDHAVVMAKFARDCNTQMTILTAKLAVTLGPDTEDLAMRFGLNSGPVTAGVLRGQKSRFQLFGDTVNTAARMESTGQKSRIHASQSTADELIKHKKGSWLRPREDAIAVKGKGEMMTYWVVPGESLTSSDGKDSDGLSSQSQRRPTPNDWQDTVLCPEISNNKIERLVDWNTDVLARLIRGIVAWRRTQKQPEPGIKACESVHTYIPVGDLVINEVKEIIELPEFDAFQAVNSVDSVDSVVLDPVVVSQLRSYVASIAATYRGSENPFHNFEHASHVSMSVAKLMSRILDADEFYDQEGVDRDSTLELFKHKRTFGITSDPLTLFACAHAALIHDVDHPGVPNTQLVKEKSTLAQQYLNRSIAEQHSVDIAWELLMDEQYSDLLRVVCPTQEELQRLRQLVVNCVMATDIMDKDLKDLRNQRWEKAFNATNTNETISHRDTVNRKATIVIEHLIQASDVAHTMQHWHVYRKWNERLFFEMYKAYKEGRAEKNPAEFWYKGELDFFEFYIIPLAKKLSECGVFGVSSNEYLRYALENRREWELKGEEIVEDIIQKLQQQHIR